VSAAAIAAPAELRRLESLYARDKALAISVGAALALGALPAGIGAEVETHRSECECAAAAEHGALAEHFRACGDAAVALGALVAETEATGEPSSERLAEARRTHRRLRALVWEVCECEYAPCGHERSH
jgi:hypothetical protein